MGMLRRQSIIRFYQQIRILKYRILSTCQQIEGAPILLQPAELSGLGKIIFNGKVHLGCYPSPFFFNGYIYIEARKRASTIEINDGVWINNNSVLISDGEGIYIGRNSLIGSNVEIFDSDFHDLSKDKRNMPGKTASVHIGENVFIGSNVKILKGVTIGHNSVIGCGSIVVKSIPDDVIAAGIPAKVIKNL